MSSSAQRRGRITVGVVVLLAAALLALSAGFAPSVSKAQTGCQELMVNGDFENGHAGWTEYSSSFYEIIDAFHPHSPQYSAWLVAVNNEEGWVSQTVSLPTGTGSLKLSYWWSVMTEENPGGAFDFMKVQLLRVDGALVTTLATYNNESAQPYDWNPVQIDLSAYAGQTLQLRFWAKNDANNATSFFVDDVSVQSCPAGGTPTETATSTLPPTVTRTPTPTLTPSPTLSVTPGPSPTPTSTPRARLYLPVIVK